MTYRYAVRSSRMDDFCIDASVALSAPVVFVADDDTSVHEALESSTHDVGWRVRILPSVTALLSLPEGAVPCCLVLDVSPPHFDGYALQRRLAAERTEMPIVCTTAQADVPAAVRAMKAGAIDVLTKPASPELLLEAIRSALEHSKVLFRRGLEVHELRYRYTSLSQRERQVMTLVVSGLLNKQVGVELGISEITVKAHRGSVMRKMNAGSFAQLVQMAAKLPSDCAVMLD
jgi:FixJ family two-component response regulator